MDCKLTLFQILDLGLTLGFILATVRAIKMTNKASKEVVNSAHSDNTFEAYLQAFHSWVDNLNRLESNYFKIDMNPTISGRKLFIQYHDDLQNILSLEPNSFVNYKFACEHNRFMLIGDRSRFEWTDKVRFETTIDGRIREYYKHNASELSQFLNFFSNVLFDAQKDLTAKRLSLLRSLVQTHVTTLEFELAEQFAFHLQNTKAQETIKNFKPQLNN